MKDANRCQNSPPLNKQPSCWEQQLDPLKKLALPFNAEARSTWTWVPAKSASHHFSPLFIGEARSTPQLSIVLSIRCPGSFPRVFRNLFFC